MKSLKNHKKLNFGRTQQAGFSLVELMIASTLGIFVIGGVITSFVGTKDSEQMRSAVSEMDANARTAIEVLRKNISLAGYRSMNVIQGFDKPFYSAVDELDPFTKGSINRSCGGGITMNTSGNTPDSGQYTADSNDVTGRGDVLTTVYLADNPCLPGKDSCSALADVNPKTMVYTDCTGGGAKRDERAVRCSTDKTIGMTESRHAKLYSTFFLGSGSEAERRTLYCSGNRGGTQPLAENIEYLQFLYGVSRPNGTTEYLKADDVESSVPNLWGNVTSVRVGLLVRSSRKGLLKTPSTKTNYLLLDRNVAVSDMQRLYKVYTTTINLPNRKEKLY